MIDHITYDVFEDKDLADYVYLKYDWVSVNSEVQDIAGRLARECTTDRAVSRVRKRDFASAFNVVMTALEVQGAYLEPIRIVTDREVYTGASRRSPAHTTEVRDALEWLIKRGYLEQTDGRRIFNKKGQRKNTYLPFEYRLSGLWRTEITASPLSEPHEIIRNPLSYYVQVRTQATGRKERKVALDLSRFTATDQKKLIDETTNLLKAYDLLMVDAKITLDGQRISPHRTTLTRIFSNGNLEDGGRLYAPIQNIDRTKRLDLKINGQTVIELDYKGLHPTMLYDIDGLEPPTDPYEIDGLERDTVKTAFNLLLNRDSKRHRSSEVDSILSNTDLSREDARRLRDGLYELHAPIAHRFNTGFGLNLQRLDSELILEFLKLALKNGSPKAFIPIHDSLLVPYKDCPDVEIGMMEIYWRLIESLNENKKVTESIEDINITRIARGGTLKLKHHDLTKEELDTLSKLYEDVHGR